MTAQLIEMPEPKFHYRDTVRIACGGFYDRELAYIKSWKYQIRDITDIGLGYYISYDVELFAGGNITIHEESLELSYSRLTEIKNIQGE